MNIKTVKYPRLAITAGSRSGVRIPKPYSKYYELYDSDEYDGELDEALQAYGMTYVAYLVAKDKYLDALQNCGYDILTLAKDSNGNLGAYFIAGDRVYDVLSEIEDAVERADEW